jgi:hypothetical protein
VPFDVAAGRAGCGDGNGLLHGDLVGVGFDDAAVIGRLAGVTAGLNRVTVHVGEHLVAGHARVWARGLTVTDPAHTATARRLREEFRQPRPSGLPGDLARDLADYDRAFGLISSKGQNA